MNRRLIELLFPPRCAACRELLTLKEREGGALCTSCMAEWRAATEVKCEKCFLAAKECHCQTELLESVSCKAFYKAVYYLHGKDNPVQNRIIYRIKNTRDRRTIEFLAGELAELLPKDELENTALSYIPRRRRAYLENGTDQARELANSLSIVFGIPVLQCLTRKKGRELEQKKLSPGERWRNARASYAVRDRAFRGMHVFLVDDIVTTGSSLAACVQKLLRAGAVSVSCIAIASDDGNRIPVAVALKKDSLFH